MLPVLLLCAMLFQAGSQTALKPLIDNDRVTIWDATGPGAQPLDAVVVSFSGSAVFLAKGMTPKAEGRSIVIDLKDHPVPPIANTSGYPLAFPRPAACDCYGAKVTCKSHSRQNDLLPSGVIG